MSPPLRPAPFWATALAFGVMYIAWGTTYLAIQKGVRDEHLPPFLFGGVRLATAGIILLVFQAFRGKPLWPRRGDWPGLIGVSLLLFVLGNGMITVAEMTVDSGMASVLAATTPLWMALFAIFWPRKASASSDPEGRRSTGERLTLGGWLGIGLGLVGVLVLNIDNLGGFFSHLGPFFVLISAASWALGSLLLKHVRPAGDHLSIAAQQLLCGGTLMCLVGWALGEEMPSRITPGAAFAFFYLLIAGSLMGFVAFNWLLGHVSANKVGTYSYVNPAVAVLVGWLDGERITLAMLAGIGIILLGVFLVRAGEQSQFVPGEEAAADVPVDWQDTPVPVERLEELQR